jgi:hypothetical protein
MDGRRGSFFVLRGGVNWPAKRGAEECGFGSMRFLESRPSHVSTNMSFLSMTCASTRTRPTRQDEIYQHTSRYSTSTPSLEMGYSQDRRDLRQVLSNNTIDPPEAESIDPP